MAEWGAEEDWARFLRMQWRDDHFRRQPAVIIKRCVSMNVARDTLPIGRASKKRPTRQPFETFVEVSIQRRSVVELSFLSSLSLSL